MKTRPLLFSLLAGLVFQLPTSASAAPCAAGYYSIDGQDPCTPCTAGTFRDSPGATVCTDCAPHTSSGEAATSCDDCPFGYYLPEAGSAPCVRRNDWSCWTVKDLKTPRFSIIHDVRVLDPWDFDFLVVKKPAFSCAPASVDGWPLTDVNGQTCCYRTGKAFRSSVTENVTVLFGNPLELAVKRRSMICEACVTSLLP